MNVLKLILNFRKNKIKNIQSKNDISFNFFLIIKKVKIFNLYMLIVLKLIFKFIKIIKIIQYMYHG